MLPLATDYPFLNILWSMIIFFAWVIYIWIAITVLIDVFRRHDIGGFTKALWVIAVIVLPFLGILIYLLVEHQGMADRQAQQVKAQQDAMDSYIKKTAGGSAAEIAQGKELLDKGAITQEEFDALKRKALAAG